MKDIYLILDQDGNPVKTGAWSNRLPVAYLRLCAAKSMATRYKNEHGKEVRIVKVTSFEEVK